jgi:hypothetical protein
MHVHVPQPWHQVRGFEIDDVGITCLRLTSCREDFRNAAVLDDDGALPGGLRADAVDQRGVGQNCSHDSWLSG